MKRLSEAPSQEFAVYVARDDTRWVRREPSDSLASLYAQGYLPYSGAKNLCDIFYSARSARIILPAFELTSENRRIARKFDGSFTKERAADFAPDDAFYGFCLNYFVHKHGAEAMPRERLETVMHSGLVSATTAYRDIRTGETAAYVLEVEEGSMAHYWFSFYDVAYARQSLGLWLMLDALRDAKERGLAEYYLGTVYGDKALYKTNFSPLEWWDGAGWSRDTAALKLLNR